MCGKGTTMEQSIRRRIIPACDGRTLILPRAVFGKLRIRGAGELARLLPRIAANSSYYGRVAPSPALQQSRVPVLVFRAFGRTRNFDLFARPARHQRNGRRVYIVFDVCTRLRNVSPVVEPEYLHEISGSARIQWISPMSLTGAHNAVKQNPGEYIYALERKDADGVWKPYYVGLTAADRRLQTHRNMIRNNQLPVTETRARIGRVTHRKGMTLKNVERIAIRAAKQQHGRRITNSGPDAKPTLIPKDKSVTLSSRGAMPDFLGGSRKRKNRLHIAGGNGGKGKRFEYEDELQQEGSYVGLAGWYSGAGK